jgi:flagellar biosynthesis protein FlhG
MHAVKRATLSLAIVSGKGGVGKTNLALNLGYALKSAGYSVLLMDCDLGLANLDVLLGLTPEKTLQDLLTPGVGSADVVLPIEEGGFDFLPSASGVPELIDMDEDTQALLFDKLERLIGGYDFLLLDLGAGISRTVLSFASMARERMVVITPEPTSLTDGYAMIKVLAKEYGIRDFRVVVNMAESAEQGKKSFARLEAACRRFLGLEVDSVGTVRTDPAVARSVIRQVPLLRSEPRATAAKDILALAVKVKKIRDERLAELEATPPLRPLPGNVRQGT